LTWDNGVIEPFRQERRVQKRSTWPVAVRGLRDRDAVPGMPESTPLERLAAVDELTRQSWSLAGLKMPDYSRRATPIKVVAVSDSVTRA
jgi:hypothetical protein